eukprot:CAMPEP_0185190228 /NCGR_PEP_ID=MMETSP1140-20130426/6529_1 /TAXON_ID=298111 /ORGANISM="Pavlova sp., Strain CCMP459" /LENGTH=146 /DNA_ID=CAMNT_0027756839 /DNA_START=124 /DNA_END=562 /DNA_ORIENTATION=+
MICVADSFLADTCVCGSSEVGASPRRVPHAHQGESRVSAVSRFGYVDDPQSAPRFQPRSLQPVRVHGHVCADMGPPWRPRGAREACRRVNGGWGRGCSREQETARDTLKVSSRDFTLPPSANPTPTHIIGKAHGEIRACSPGFGRA